MKYIMIFHANLHYSNLHPDQYDFVIRHSYERVLDLFNKKYPQARWVFEASGFKNLILDWDAFLLETNDEVRKVEYNPNKSRLQRMQNMQAQRAISS